MRSRRRKKREGGGGYDVNERQGTKTDRLSFDSSHEKNESGENEKKFLERCHGEKSSAERGERVWREEGEF